MRVRGVDAISFLAKPASGMGLVCSRVTPDGRVVWQPPTATARIRHVPDRRPGSHPKSSLVKIPREMNWRDAGREAHEGKVASRSPAGATPLALGTRVNLSSIERRLRDHARQHSVVPAPGAPGDERGCLLVLGLVLGLSSLFLLLRFEKERREADRSRPRRLRCCRGPRRLPRRISTTSSPRNLGASR